MTPPLVFEPLFMERVWGGRRLETLLGKRLEPGVRIGEAQGFVKRVGGLGLGARHWGGTLAGSPGVSIREREGC